MNTLNHEIVIKVLSFDSTNISLSILYRYVYVCVRVEFIVESFSLFESDYCVSTMRGNKIARLWC